MTLADKYQGKRLNSPNDAALKSNGDIYFTDPPYGLPSDTTIRAASSITAASIASQSMAS